MDCKIKSGVLKLNQKTFKTIAALTIAAVAFTMTGCGDSIIETDFFVSSDKTYETISGSGNIASKNISLSDGFYSVSVGGISSTDSTIKVEITASGSSAELKADDNVIDDFSFKIDDENKTIALTVDSDIMYKNINCTVTINGLVNEIEIDGITEVNYMVPDNSDLISITASGASSVIAEGSCTNAQYRRPAQL